MKEKRTKIERVIKEVDNLYEFYKNIPKIQESEKRYKIKDNKKKN